MSRYDRPSYERTLAHLHVLRLLDTLGSRPTGIHVVAVPVTAEAEAWMTAALRHFRDIKQAADLGVDVSEMPVEDVSASDIDASLLTSAGLDSGHSGAACMLFFTESGNTDLAHPTVTLADSVITVEFARELVVQAAAEHGRQISMDEADLLARMPPRRRRIAMSSSKSIEVLWRLHKQADADAEAQEKAVEASKAKPTTRNIPDVAPLENMYGYGDAKAWGLELARDIADYRAGDIKWSDVDTGILLSGPPGCGKTTFAQALARTLDAHLVVGSYSAWLGTGDGHQGDLLKAMKAAFAEAKKHAPAVLLIDEIDNFPTRGSIGHGRSDEWSRGVVNGLLEQLDGAIDRDGVIVVGATNDASGIDPALRRPGRLDRHIEIPLPDDDARVAILRQHLGVDLDLRLLRRKTAGMSGADLERVARDARRLARREGVEVRHSHVARALPRREPRTAEDLRHISVHEAGHAIVAAVLGADIAEVFVTQDRDPSGSADIAGAAVVGTRAGRRDYQWHADYAAHLLGGMAAEQAVYDSHGDGVVLDLAEATNILTYAITSLGMGDTLLSDGHRDPQSLAAARAFDPVLRRRVEDALQDQADRAREIIARNRAAFDDLVERLVQRGRLDGSEVHDVIAAYRQPQLSLAI